MVIPNHKIISLLHNSNFAAVMNCNVNTWYVGFLTCNPVEESFDTPKESRPDPQVENHWYIAIHQSLGNTPKENWLFSSE